MASNALKNPFFRVVANRTFSAQAKPRANAAAVGELKSAVLANKMVVASVENFSPVTSVSVTFRAGSRFEDSDELGTTHVLRIAAGLATAGYSQCGIIRNLQQLGANLTASSDREFISYTLEGTSQMVECTLDILCHVATQQEFKPWEISDNLPRLKYELASIPSGVKAVDLLHKAAFKTDLGNSLFCPKHRIGKISSETLQHYVQEKFTAGRAAVVGVGIKHDKLMEFAQSMEVECGKGAESCSKYRGGEIRKDTSDPLAHVAVAVEGAGFKKVKEALAFGVAQFAFGVGPSVRWGAQAGSPFGKIVQGFSSEGAAALSAFNASYADTGLFGFVVSCEPHIAACVVGAAVKQLRSGKLSDADITRGKALLKSHILMSSESSSQLSYDLTAQALLLGNVTSPTDLASCVDQISVGDVNAALKKVASSELSMGAVGTISCVPYLDEL